MKPKTRTLPLIFHDCPLWYLHIQHHQLPKKKQTNKQRKAIQPFHSREVCRGIAICFCSICFAVLSDFKWRYDILSSFKICMSQFFMFCGMVAMVTSLKLRGFLGYLTFTWENWKFGWKIKRRWPYHLGNRGEDRWEDEHLFTWFGYNLYWVLPMISNLIFKCLCLEFQTTWFM